MTPTNPSSATPLDVEACVRLVDDMLRWIAPHDEPSFADAAVASRLRTFLTDELPELVKDQTRIDWMETTRRGIEAGTMDDHLGEPTRKLWCCDGADASCLMPTVREAIDRAAAGSLTEEEGDDR